MFLSEVFFGWQGEGFYAGSPQVFVRLAGCPLRCAYCDTPDALVRTPFCRIRYGGEHDVTDAAAFENPVKPAWVAERVREILGTSGPVHSVSLTGGEPLAQAEGLADLARELRRGGGRTYLETAGVLPQRFAEVSDLFDFVAMDLKIPSATGEPPRWEDHARFLTHSDPARTFVKAVVAGATRDAEILEAARVTAARSPAIPFFLQPATRVHKGRCGPPSVAALRRWAGLAARRLSRVFVSCQWQRPQSAAEAS